MGAGNIFYEDYCDYLIENLDGFNTENVSVYKTDQFEFCFPEIYDNGDYAIFSLTAYGFFPDANPSGSRYGYDGIDVLLTFDKDQDVKKIWAAINEFIEDNKLEEE